MFRSSARWSEVKSRLGWALCLVLGLPLAPASAQTKRSCEEIEAFLRNAKMGARKGPAVLLDDGTMQHRAFPHNNHDSEVSLTRYRDSWKAIMAAYELAKILEINIIPPSVERQVDGRPGSLAWGLDNVMMDEVQRNKGNVQPPDMEVWNKQLHAVRVFDELVYHGRAPSDLLITRDWQMWIIAPSQAFRPNQTLQDRQNLVRCDRKLLAKIRKLDKGELMKKLGKWLTREEIEALHARAGKIAEFFDREIAGKGEAAVLYELDRSGGPCVM
jgi:hypothetical protein